MAMPLMAPYGFISVLFVWYLPLIIPIPLLAVLLWGDILLAMLTMAVLTPILLLVMLWLLNWTAIYFQLLFSGNTELARDKEKQLTERLVRLARVNEITRPAPPGPAV